MTVATVDHTADIADKSVSITLPHNERGTARFTTKPGYIPALRSEVVFYDMDSTTPIFGGIVFQRSSRGVYRSNFVECECADWTWYLDHITVAGGAGLTGTFTLKQVLEWLQTNYLSGYGFTLDAAQVTGPTATVTGFEWERKFASEVLRDLTKWSSGYVFSVSPTKVWKMALPSFTPTAPFAISDTTPEHARELQWTETSEHYATRIVGKVGGTGTRDAVQTWTVDAGIIAAGYVQTDAPSTPTGGVSARINTGSGFVAATVGPNPAAYQLVWDWVTHRLTPGTYVPSIGHIVELTYTAQYPFEVIADSGATPPNRIDRTMQLPDLTDAATAQAMVNGALVQANQSPRDFEAESIDSGWRPGQVVSINSTYRDSASMTALITSVSIRLITNTLWSHRLTATTGVYQGSGLDFWRSLGGGGGIAATATVTYTTGTNPTVGQPLTKVDDTNVTLTLGGSHATALFAPASLTLGWTGQLDVSRGGTGLSSIAANRIPYGSSPSVMATSASLTFDGQTLTLAPSAGTVSAMQAFGRANAYTAYLQGSATAGQSYGLLLQAGTNASDAALAVVASAGTPSLFGINGAGDISMIGDIGHPSYASQTTNWRVTTEGTADFRYLFVDEMHAKSFIADLEQALAGGQIIAKSVAMLAVDFTAPSAGSGDNITIRDLPSAGNMAAFQSGDQVVLRTFSRASGALTIADCVGIVTSYTDNSGAQEGTQTWFFTRNSGGSAGTMTASTVVKADSLVIDYGVSGNGYHEVNAIDGTYGANSPYSQTVTWTTAPVAANRSIRTRMGNLSGAYGYSGGSNIFGFAAGDGAATNITIDPTNGFRIRYGTTNKLVADTSGNLSLTGSLVVSGSGSFTGGDAILDTSGITLNTATSETYSEPKAYSFSLTGNETGVCGMWAVRTVAGSTATRTLRIDNTNIDSGTDNDAAGIILNAQGRSVSPSAIYSTTLTLGSGLTPLCKLSTSGATTGADLDLREDKLMVSKKVEVTESTTGVYTGKFLHTHASNPLGISVQYNAQPNDTGHQAYDFFDDVDGTPVLRFSVQSNGGIANYSANNVNLSDVRSKVILGPALSQRELFRQLPIVLGRYTDTTRDTDDVMLTAQAVQAIYPDLVEPFDGELLGVREHGLMMRAFKVIQELDAEVTALSQRCAALEARS